MLGNESQNFPFFLFFLTEKIDKNNSRLTIKIFKNFKNKKMNDQIINLLLFLTWFIIIFFSCFIFVTNQHKVCNDVNMGLSTSGCACHDLSPETPANIGCVDLESVRLRL